MPNFHAGKIRRDTNFQDCLRVGLKPRLIKTSKLLTNHKLFYTYFTFYLLPFSSALEKSLDIRLQKHDYRPNPENCADEKATGSQRQN
jgi:hypothetical protein